MRRTIVLSAVAAVFATCVAGLAGARETTGPACAPGDVPRGIVERLPSCGRPAAALAPPASAAAAARGPAPANPVFTPTACPDGLFPPDRTVDCGFVTVPENRARPNGRSITVAAAVMRATTRRPKADPIVFVDGGPSFGAISDFAAFSYFGGASYADERDVVLVDTRGTGLSETPPRLPRVRPGRRGELLREAVLLRPRARGRGLVEGAAGLPREARGRRERSRVVRQRAERRRSRRSPKGARATRSGTSSRSLLTASWG